jgi:enamine deaminase RidA (YjgF/YER057c/UK114 family)
MSDLESAESYGLSGARKAGCLLFCSGQIGVEADGTVPLDASRQFALAFGAVGDVLARHGATVADIVDLTTFHVGFPDHMDAFMAAKATFLNGTNCCWTAIGAAALGYPGSLVEIKAVASLPTPAR